MFGNAKLSWPGVDQRQVLFQGRWTDPRKIPAFRVKLSQQSVQVFVRPFLPCAVRIGEIHIALQRFLYLSPTGELAPSVAGDRLYRFFRELGKRIYDRFRHRFSLPVRDLHGDIVSRLSLRERGKTRLAFPLSRHHRVRFPMPEFFAVIYAFIPFAYAFPRREPSAVPQPLPRFSFPAQVFKGGTKIPFVYPTINCFERRHLHPARRFGDLFGRPCLRQFLVYVIQYLLLPEHSPVPVTVPKIAFLLCRIRVVSGNISVKRTVPSQLP